jgi:hypothetical protein
VVVLSASDRPDGGASHARNRALSSSYAERIERHSCIPRAWGNLNPTESTDRRYAR